MSLKQTIKRMTALILFTVLALVTAACGKEGEVPAPSAEPAKEQVSEPLEEQKETADNAEDAVSDAQGGALKRAGSPHFSRNQEYRHLARGASGPYRMPRSSLFRLSFCSVDPVRR